MCWLIGLMLIEEKNSHPNNIPSTDVIHPTLHFTFYTPIKDDFVANDGFSFVGCFLHRLGHHGSWGMIKFVLCTVLWLSLLIHLCSREAIRCLAGCLRHRHYDISYVVVVNDPATTRHPATYTTSIRTILVFTVHTHIATHNNPTNFLTGIPIPVPVPLYLVYMPRTERWTRIVYSLEQKRLTTIDKPQPIQRIVISQVPIDFYRLVLSNPSSME